jgi:hypothetical protein
MTASELLMTLWLSALRFELHRLKFALHASADARPCGTTVFKVLNGRGAKYALWKGARCDGAGGYIFEEGIDVVLPADLNLCVKRDVGMRVAAHTLESRLDVGLRSLCAATPRKVWIVGVCHWHFPVWLLHNVDFRDFFVVDGDVHRVIVCSNDTVIIHEC